MSRSVAGGPGPAVATDQALDVDRLVVRQRRGEEPVPVPARRPARHGRSEAPAPVVAVLVAHDGAAWLPRSLAALRASTVRPSVVVAVDTGSVDETATMLAADAAVDEVVTLDRRVGFGAAVAAGVARAMALVAQRPGTPDVTWLWLLHDDCAPEPTALAYLLDAVAGAPTIAVAGAKLLAWDDTRRLLEVGVPTARIGGRRDESPLELDQGQHDARSDVIATSTAGTLIRRDVLDAVRGFDPALPLLGDDVDLCRRIRLAGHRVVVVPAARVAHAGALTAGGRPGDALRGRRHRGPGPVAAGLHRYETRHWLYLRLVAAPLPAVIPLLVWLAMVTLGSGVVAAASGDRRRALGWVLAWWDVVTRPWRLVAGSYRLRRTRRAGAAAEPASSLPGRMESVRDRAGRWALGRGFGAAALADRARRLRLIAATVTAVAVASWAAVRVVAGRQPVASPDLPVAADAITTAELWQRAAGGVTAVGGAPVVTDPAAGVWAVLGAMAGSVQLTLPGEATLAMATRVWSWAVLPLAVVAAWLALREVVGGRRLSTALALGWAVLPLAAAAAAVPYAADIDLRLVHALLPLTAWGLLLAMRPAPPTWRPAALGLAVAATTAVVALQPSVWPVVWAIGSASLLALWRRRDRGGTSGSAISVLALLLAPALLWPQWAWTALRDPTVVLLPPAHRTPAAGVAALDLPGFAFGLVAVAVLGVAVLAWLAGLLTAVRRGTSTSWRVAGLLGTLLAAWCVALSGVPSLGPFGGLDALGAGLDAPWACMVAALTAAAALAAGGATAGPTVPRTGRVPAGMLLTAVGALVVVAGAAVWAPAAVLPAWGSATRPGLPVPAALDAAGAERSGVLTLTSHRVEASTSDGVGADGVGAGGATDLLWSVDRGQWGPGSATAATRAGTASASTAGATVGDAVADVVTRLLADSPSAAQDLPAALGNLAIGWVVVDGAGAPALAAREAVASRAGLSAVSDTPVRSVWRVDGAGVTSWARLLPAAGATAAQPLPATAGGLDVTIDPGEPGRLVTLAAEDAAAWRATLDGRVVVPRALDGGRVGIDVGSDGGDLLVTRAEVLSLPGGRWWWLGSAVLLAAAIVAAGPGRRGRERRPHEPDARVSRRSSGVAVMSVAVVTVAVVTVAVVTVAVVSVILVPVTAVLPAALAGDLERDFAAGAQLPRVVRVGAATALSHCPGDVAAPPAPPAGGSVSEWGTAEVALPAGTAASDTGNQVSLATGGALAGTIALTSCPLAADSGWAFAGGTGVGERPRLVLDNPGAVPAGYAVELLTASGRQRPVAGGTGLVAAGQAQTLAVDALLPGQGVLAVEVRATSGALAGTVRDTAVSGLLGLGADDEAMAQPATTLVVPALVTGGSDAATPAPGAPAVGTSAVDAAAPGDAGVSYLAVAVPGEVGGVATVRIAPVGLLPVGTAQGSTAVRNGEAVLPGPLVVPVAAGSVATVPLDLPSGAYSLWIDADVPVVAAARSSLVTASATAAPADLGWAAAVEPDDIASRRLTLPLAPDAASVLMTIATGTAHTLSADVLDEAGAVLRRVRVDTGPAATGLLDLTGTPAAVAVRLHSAAADGMVVTGAVGLVVTAAPVAEQPGGSTRDDPADAAAPHPRALATATVMLPGADASTIQLVPR